MLKTALKSRTLFRVYRIHISLISLLSDSPPRWSLHEVEVVAVFELSAPFGNTLNHSQSWPWRLSCPMSTGTGRSSAEPAWLHSPTAALQKQLEWSIVVILWVDFRHSRRLMIYTQPLKSNSNLLWTLASQGKTTSRLGSDGPEWRVKRLRIGQIGPFG